MEAMCSALSAASSTQHFPGVSFPFQSHCPLTDENNGVFTLLPPRSPKERYHGLNSGQCTSQQPKKYRNRHLVLGSGWAERLRDTQAVGKNVSSKRDNHCGYKRLNSAHVQDSWNQLIYSELELSPLQISEVNPNQVIAPAQSCNRET